YVKGTGGAAAPSTTARRRGREEGPPLLRVEGLTKRFGGVAALDNVTFDVFSGQVLGIIGPNGSGKTTMFDVISGFQAPDAGRVVFEGVDITGMGPDE